MQENYTFPREHCMKIPSRYFSWPNAIAAIAASAIFMGFSWPAAAQTTLRQSNCATETLSKLGAVCYEFTGEENWDNPNGRKVKLPVAVIPGNAPEQAPVFFFPGGPGSSILLNENYIREQLDQIGPRTLVLVEDRGLVHAKPALQCPGRPELERSYSPDKYGLGTLEERIEWKANFVKRCYRELKDKAIDVSLYTDYQTVRDYDEVRKALGYEKINIYGISNGGGEIATYLTYHGNHVRSAIFGYPWLAALRGRPAIDEFFASKELFNDMLGICVRDDKECASKLPGYLSDIDRARAILDAKPYITTVPSEVEPGGRLKIRIDGATFLAQLYDERNLDFNYYQLPKTLLAIKRGDYSALDEYFNLGAIDKLAPESASRSFGQLWSNMCGSMGKNRLTPEEAISMIKREPALMGFESNVFCAWWGEDGNLPPNFNTIPVSNVPALAIHGQVDACCNIRSSKLLANSMPHLQRVELQAQGHQGPGAGCRKKLISAFLDSPEAKVDDSCKNDEPLRKWVFE